MKLSSWVAGISLLVLASLILFPVYYPYIHSGKREAYQRILDFHQANNAPMDGWMYSAGHKAQAKKPFLYLSWFPQGDPRHAEEFMAYPDGKVLGRRVLWNNAIQGGGGVAQSLPALRQLEQMPPLPEGLATPNDVPYGRLLVVSQGQNGRWRTLYYDRRHLPVTVRSMTQSAGSLVNGFPHFDLL